MAIQTPHIAPEWAPQSAVWIGWPHIMAEWGVYFHPARKQIAAFVKALSAVTPVKIACGSREAYTSAWLALLDPDTNTEADPERISLHTLPVGDVWLRDTGPVIISDKTGHATALDFRFNGWGGKHVIANDTIAAAAIAAVEQIPVDRHDLVLEGGAIDADGAGRLLAARQCILHPARNPDLDESRAETLLKQAFGVSEIIWLDACLRNDHTDGHVDTLARFIAPGVAVCQTPCDDNDPNADILPAVEKQLRAHGLDVACVSSPGLVTDTNGNLLPASHVNFLISNRHVFLPVYEAIHAPHAIAALAEIMPDYQVTGIPADAILTGGGALHCISRQIPAI